MKRLAVAGVLILPVLAAPGPAAARTCSLDVVPAATLLLPYFEVDLQSPTGRTTLVSIANAADEAALAHVVLWTDLGFPTLAFDVYLTGFDVQTINLRDLFDGRLPQTASDGQDANDQISPKGAQSQDVNFASCSGLLPPAAVPPAFVDHLRKVHQGLSSPLLDSKCAAQFFDTGTARGYATIDAVRRCSTLTPADAGYFGPDGVAAHDNVLWGDFFFVDPAGNLAQGENLVRIESDPARFAGKPTFYARYVKSTGADGREPLPTIWGARFINGGAFTGGTDFIYWRDSRHVGTSFLCSQKPSWYPIHWEFERTTVFDEEENPDQPVCPITCPPSASPFPAESGRVAVGGSSLAVPFDFGWWYLDMKTGDFQNATGLSQAWMGTLHDAQGKFSAGLEAEPFDSGCAPSSFLPGFLGNN
jgi:hypothetical protein